MSEWPFIAQLHLFVGTACLFAGSLAMLSKKGRALHRCSGFVFVCLMSLLCLSSFYLSVTRHLQLTFVLGALSWYLVLTGWFAIKRKDSQQGWFEYTAFAFIFILSSLVIILAVLAIIFSWPHPETEPPYSVYLGFGLFGLFFAYLDFRLLRQGGALKHQRIKRHIWRMTFSMFIATFIFFTGNTHVLPEFLRLPLLLALPPLLVIASLCWFLWRARRVKTHKA
ncbi:hypothetical protein [Agaribacterium sp. ZY112]|uniref:hypothetical protein n=1 Tax=Agaribacterium sp. ZY112 TaxID=3233574 RepID=UPI003525D405